MDYQVRSFRQNQTGNPVPAQTYVYIRRVSPELPLIYRIAIGANGAVGQVSQLSDNRTEWRAAPGPLSVAENSAYACCWMPQSEAASLQPYFILAALDAGLANPNRTTPARSDASSQQLRAVRYTTPAPTTTETDRRTQAGLLLHAYEERVRGKVNSWRRVAEWIGAAYDHAFTNYQQAIGQRQNAESAVFYTVITACLTPVLSWFGELIQLRIDSERLVLPAPGVPPPLANVNARDLPPWLTLTLPPSPSGRQLQRLQEVYPYVRFTLQTPAGAALAAAQTATASQPNSAASTPVETRNEFIQPILDLDGQLDDLFDVENRRLAGLPAAAFELSDESAIRNNFSQWETATSNMAGIEALPTRNGRVDKAAMAIELERGLWAQWIPANLVHQNFISDTLIGSNLQTSYGNVGGLLEQRFYECRITRDARVTSYGRLWTDASEIQRLVSWARGHRSRNFTELSSGTH